MNDAINFAAAFLTKLLVFIQNRRRSLIVLFASTLHLVVVRFIAPVTLRGAIRLHTPEIKINAGNLQLEVGTLA